MISPKLWLREVKDLEWDEVFSEEEKKRWELWISSLVGLEGLSVKRCVKPASEEIEICELQHFADGSSFAYRAISFLRVVLNDHSVCCSFLMGKGYIAQVKRTVPQLELMGAVTAVRLDQLLRKELTLPVAKSVFWSDSTATLQSIFSSKKKDFLFFLLTYLLKLNVALISAIGNMCQHLKTLLTMLQRD